MSKSTLAFSAMIFAFAAWPALSEPGHYTISAQQVAATVSRAGVQVEPEQVRLLTDVVASQANPALTIRSMEPWGDQRMLVRMECQNQKACLPFFVSLRVSRVGDKQAAAQFLNQAPLAVLASRSSSRQFVVRTGSLATLLLDSDHVHIRVLVVCLENGAVGQTIHVRGKEHRVIYEAEVVDGTLLKGRTLDVTSVRRICVGVLWMGILACAIAVPMGNAKTNKKTSPVELRSDYIARLQEQEIPKAEHTVGSLWTSGEVSDLSTDYKARKLNDTVVILVAVQTTAAQTGNVNSQRGFQTSSAITGLAGGVSTSNLNPLFNANSSTTLKGAGATNSSTTFQTSMTAQVVAVLPSGNLVVEAQRKIFMNNQHEDVMIRGVVRPRDIGPNNTVPSAALSNLEIEMKGKGIIADSTRPPNRITRAILWLLGF